MSNSIRVATPCVSERTRTTLEFFFQKHCQNRFQISNINTADMYILDLDVIGGMLILEKLQQDSPLKPVVALTVREENIDGVQIMRKPIQLDVLERAFDFYYEEHQRKKLRDTSDSDANSKETSPISEPTQSDSQQLEENELAPGTPPGFVREPLDIDLSRFDSESSNTVKDSGHEPTARPLTADTPVQTRSSGISALFGGYVEPATNAPIDTRDAEVDQQVSDEHSQPPQWAVNTIEISLVKESIEFTRSKEKLAAVHPNPPENEAKTDDSSQDEVCLQEKIDNKPESGVSSTSQVAGGSLQNGDEEPQSSEKGEKTSATPEKLSSAKSSVESVRPDQTVSGLPSTSVAGDEMAEPLEPDHVAAAKPEMEENTTEGLANDPEPTEKIRSSSTIEISATQQSPSITPSLKQASASSSRSIADLGRIVRECCGNRDDLDPSLPEQREQLFYRTQDSLQSHVQSAIEMASARQQPVSIVLEPGKSIVVLPRERRVITTIKEQILRARTRLAIEEDQLKIEVYDSSEEATFLEGDHLSNDPIEAFLWKIALWTSYGRVVEGTDLDASVQLKQWPNFTRLVTIPQFMRICSYWSKEEASLLQTASVLGLPQRYVFSFFSACQALQLIDLTAKAAPIKTNDPEPVVPLETNKRRGLFSRLINHLRNSA